MGCRQQTGWLSYHRSRADLSRARTCHRGTANDLLDTARHCASSDPSSGCAAPLSKAWGHTHRHTPAVFVAD
ncbi:hypothetical protein Ddc_06038 [Ditylenchus destructor]|nr:hypothetical protein Ddc_06038 [Ditylenchus destructor]